MTPHPAVTLLEHAAILRLLDIAARDTGQSRRVADFLLAWWNAGACGGFDFTNLWALDSEIAADIVITVGLIARCHSYPDTLGYAPRFARVVAAWRPELTSD